MALIREQHAEQFIPLGTVTKTKDGGIDGLSFGNDNEIPFSNSTGTDFDYDADLTWAGDYLTIITQETDDDAGIWLQHSGTGGQHIRFSTSRHAWQYAWGFVDTGDTRFVLTGSTSGAPSAELIQAYSTGLIIMNVADVRINEGLVHNGDTDTKIIFTTDRIQLQAGGVTYFDATEAGSDTLTLGASASVVTTILGGLAYDTAAKTTTYQITKQDRTLFYDATAGAFTMTMPAISSVPTGWEVHIHETAGLGTALTIARTGSDLINGGTSVGLATPFSTMILVSDGSRWIAYEPAVGA